MAELRDAEAGVQALAQDLREEFHLRGRARRAPRRASTRRAPRWPRSRRPRRRRGQRARRRGGGRADAHPRALRRHRAHQERQCRRHHHAVLLRRRLQGRGGDHRRHGRRWKSRRTSPKLNLGKIKVGQPCEIQLDALPDVRLLGVVSRIVPTVDRAKATVLVKVRFAETRRARAAGHERQGRVPRAQCRPDESKPRHRRAAGRDGRARRRDRACSCSTTDTRCRRSR